MTTNLLLFPKSSATFDLSLFQSPTCEYRGAPLWSWNTKLDREELHRQIDHFKEMGMGGFYIHSRNGLATAYMGTEFMDLVESCVKYGAKQGLMPCLYDEDRWPSGSAGGLVTKDHPEFQSQHLLITKVKYGEGVPQVPAAFMGFAARSERGRLLARYEVQLDDAGYLSSFRRLQKDEEIDSRHLYYAYIEPNMPSDWYNSQTYVDTLNKGAISRFIELTHERYKSKVGTFFAETIPTIFTDEPQFASKTQLLRAASEEDIFLPWTEDLQESFMAACGENLLENLPEILWDLPGNRASRVRYHFHDHVCERFVQAFMDQIASWCSLNKILLTGHMMEEPFLKTQTGSLGEAMRCYRNLDLPGIDLLCDQFEFNTAKQASSVARQNGSRGTMSEIYGVTGWTFTFEGHKGCGDWQAALGITHRVHHLTWVSLAGEGKRDFPASIGYQSPWYSEYSLVEDYFARVNVILTRGNPITRIAVIHPVESYWISFGPCDTGRGIPEYLEACHRDLTHWMLHSLIDFDFISESLFPEQTPESAIGERLPVGECQYDAVIVPNLKTIRSTTVRRLDKFVRSGGLVLVAGTSPELVDASPYGGQILANATHVSWSKHAIISSLDSFKEILVNDVDTGLTATSLLYQLRQDDENRLLFVCNTDRMKSITAGVRLKGHWTIQLLDPFSGDVRHLTSSLSGDWTVFNYIFYGTGSFLARLKPRTIPVPSVPAAPSVDQRVLPLIFGQYHETITLDSVSFSEHNVLVLDFAEVQLSPAKGWRQEDEILRIDNSLRLELGIPLRSDAYRQPWSIEECDRAPKERIRLRYSFESDIVVQNAFIALEDAETTGITMNGNHVTVNSTDRWWVDRDIKLLPLPTISKGANVLELSARFGMMTNLERIYILGDFGVDLRGRMTRIVELNRDRITFGDWTRQLLPFYAGNITYHCAFTVSETEAPGDPQPFALKVPQFASPILSVKLNQKEVGKVAFEPRMLELGNLMPGRYSLDITCYGNRENSFGPLHLVEGKTTWIGPSEFRTDVPGWYQSEYNVKRMGILQAPHIWKHGQTKALVHPHYLRHQYERAQQRP